MGQSLWELLVRLAKVSGGNAFDKLLDEINRIFAGKPVDEEEINWEEYFADQFKQRKSNQKQKSKYDEYEEHSYDDWEYWERVYNESRGYKHQYQYQSRQKAYTTSQQEKIVEYYKTLEIQYGAGIEEIKAAWKKMMKKYHPDLHANDPEKYQTALEITKTITHAYQELMDWVKKNS